MRGVGTWPLKSTFYSYLRLAPDQKSGAPAYPPGYCHTGTFLDEVYFKQITSEYLAKEKLRGRERQVWKVRGGAENHFLDCRIYNMALTDPYLASFTSDDWAARAKERGIPSDMRAPDLFAPREFTAPKTEPASIEAARPADAFSGLADLNKGVW